jgi:6-pyruvoyltetrahydropterin/6-carboxytetrahydropterin synthase
MYTVTKEIHFCYGHRLMHHAGKCRNLHGHSARAVITVLAENLDRRGMVCDFADISVSAAAFIDAHLDHNLLLHRDDPAVPLLRQAGERFLALDEHPTAEVLARLIYRHMQSEGFNVESVALWETSSAQARYAE